MSRWRLWDLNSCNLVHNQMKSSMNSIRDPQVILRNLSRSIKSKNLRVKSIINKWMGLW